MSRAKTAAAPLDAHGQRVEPDTLYESTDAWVAEITPGVELSARRGQTALGSTEIVQRCAWRFKRAGTASPPRADTLAEAWQPPAPPPPRDPRTLRKCVRQINGASGGMFRVVYPGECVTEDDPLIADMPECFRPLTAEEVAEHEAARS